MNKKIHKFTDSAAELLGYYTALLLLCSTGYSLAENESFGDSLWWGIVTSLSIGYGDFYPETTEGRVIGAILGFGTLFIVIPLIVGKVISTLMYDENEFNHEEQEELKRQLVEANRKLDNLQRRSLLP